MAKENRDPVCGMSVDPARARKVNLAGEEYVFCSDACRQKFEANPTQYAQSQA